MPPFNQFGPHRPPTSTASRQKCSNLMEWGGRDARASARGAGVVRECSTGRPERYIRTMRKDGTRAGRARSRRRKNTLIIRGSLAIYEARCPGVVSHGAREDVEAARRRRPAPQVNDDRHHPHRDTF